MSALATHDAEISRLQAEAAAVERAPKSFDQVWPGVEAALLDAEASFRELGPLISGFISQRPEDLHRQRVVAIGAAMCANKKAILDSERTRIRAVTEGGISAADKARRLEQLGASILRAAARRELALREVEGAGEFLPRSVHPELLIYPQAEVARLAAS